jgi:hypothetical protein
MVATQKCQSVKMKLAYKDICAKLIRLVVLLCLLGHFSNIGCMNFLTYSVLGSDSYANSNLNICLCQSVGPGNGNDCEGNSERTNSIPWILSAVWSFFIPGVEAQESANFTYTKQGAKFLESDRAYGKGFANIRRHIMNPEGDSLSSAVHGSGSYSGEKSTEFYSINITDNISDGSGEDYHYLDEHAPFFYSYPDYDSLASKNDTLFTSYSGTSFPLPLQRSINFASMWSDVTHAVSKQADISFLASYMYATKLNKSIGLDVDESNLYVNFESDFLGAGDIRYRSEYSNYMDRYVGTFRVSEDATSDTATFSSSGNGFVDIAKRINKEGIARSYEHGSGDLNLEEQIEPEDNYLAKNISLTYKPVKFDLGSGKSLNQSLKWSEGISSQEEERGRVSEKFTGLDKLQKDSVISDLTQIRTEAKFTGKGEFSVDSKNITDEQEYVGDYSIRRNVSIVRYPRYNKAHIKAIEEVYFDPANCNVVNYVITLTNDGVGDLWPIFVKDTFPLGSTYLESTKDPIELTSRYANWSIEGLYPGESVSIGLKLNLIKKVDKLTNRVRAIAYNSSTYGKAIRIYGDYNSTILLDPNRCAPQELLLSTNVVQDTDNKHNITYRFTLENQADYNMSVNLSADVLNDAKMLSSSPKPKTIGENNLSWSFKLASGKKKTLSYKVNVKRDGLISIGARAYGVSLDGQRHSSRDSRASVFIAKPNDLSVNRIVDDWLPEDLADPLRVANTDGSVPCLCLSLPNETLIVDQPEIELIRNIQGYEAGLPCC